MKLSNFEEVGVHLPTYIYEGLTTERIIDVANHAFDAGLQRMWVNDNLRFRNPFTMMSAIASRSKMPLGVAALVPYFRNPVDVADALATVGDMAGGTEISLAIAKGSHVQTSRQVEVIKPISMVRETISFLREILAGNEVRFDQFPTVSAYFRMRSPGGRTTLGINPRLSVGLYCGGNGPRVLAATAATTDGVMFSGHLVPFLRLNMIPELLAIYDRAASTGGPARKRHRFALIGISVASDGRLARKLTRPNVASSMVSLRKGGLSDERFSALGVTPDSVNRIVEASSRQLPPDQVADLVTDAMIDATQVAGDPETCRARLAELLELVKRNGFDRLVLSKLGPDPGESLKVITDTILPSL